jgi:hypothetical protein
VCVFLVLIFLSQNTFTHLLFVYVIGSRAKLYVLLSVTTFEIGIEVE